MVSASGDLQAASSQKGYARSGSHGNQVQRQGAEVLFPVQGRQPTGDRCSVDTVEVQAGLHLPSVFHDSEGIDENPSGSGIGDSHQTILAEEILVYPAHSDESGTLLEAPPTADPGVVGHSPLPRSAQVQPDSLEVDQSLPNIEGLSESVLRTLSHSRAESTKKAYSRIMRIFEAWCDSRQVASADPPLPAILQFLQGGLDRGLSPATLKVQVYAISACLNRPHSWDPLIKRFLKGAERLKPTILKPIPQWDLSVVLRGLASPPFEPLEEVELRFLT